ncbi:unnamed protein product, partial [Scytosiphon promiscuus]
AEGESGGGGYEADFLDPSDRGEGAGTDGDGGTRVVDLEGRLGGREEGGHADYNRNARRDSAIASPAHDGATPAPSGGSILSIGIGSDNIAVPADAGSTSNTTAPNLSANSSLPPRSPVRRAGPSEPSSTP